MNLLDDLKWRYATKKMNGKKVSEEKIEYILDAARLAPSSSGIQPFEIYVISNEEVKEKMRPIANDQSQITDSSHVLVFAAWDNYTEERLNNIFHRISSKRGFNEDRMDNYKNSLLKKFSSRSSEENFNHAARQAYISLGMALAAAAEQRVDSTPMEGFNNEKMDEFLGLKEKGLKSVALLCLGYRDEEHDWLVHLKKVRQPKEKFFTELN